MATFLVVQRHVLSEPFLAVPSWRGARRDSSRLALLNGFFHFSAGKVLASVVDEASLWNISATRAPSRL